MNALSPEAISSIVGKIYQAAYEPAEWRRAIDEIHALLNCSRACIAHTGAAPWSAIATIDDDGFHSAESFAAHMRDPFVSASMGQSIGTTFRRYEVIDETEFQRRELWNEWMLPRDMWRGLTCNLHNDQTGTWSVHLHRGRRQSEFNAEEARALQIFSDHMIRAKRISDQIHTQGRFAQLFEQLPIGIALVDGTGKLEFLNKEAETLLSRSTSIGIRSSRIVCEDQTTQTKFSALVAEAMSSHPLGTRGGTIVVQNEHDGLASVVVSVAPFSGPEYFGLSSQSSAIVIIRDIFELSSKQLDTYVRDLFGLTAAEASLSVLLAAGLPLQEAASRNGIMTKTARTYLERIFSKTGTRQQSQLVALIKGTRPLLM